MKSPTPPQFLQLTSNQVLVLCEDDLDRLSRTRETVKMRSSRNFFQLRGGKEEEEEENKRLKSDPWEFKEGRGRVDGGARTGRGSRSFGSGDALDAADRPGSRRRFTATRSRTEPPTAARTPEPGARAANFPAKPGKPPEEQRGLRASLPADSRPCPGAPRARPRWPNLDPNGTSADLFRWNFSSAAGWPCKLPPRVHVSVRARFWTFGLMRFWCVKSQVLWSFNFGVKIREMLFFNC